MSVWLAAVSAASGQGFSTSSRRALQLAQSSLSEPRYSSQLPLHRVVWGALGSWGSHKAFRRGRDRPRGQSRSTLYMKTYMFYHGAASPRLVRDRSRGRSRSILYLKIYMFCNIHEVFRRGRDQSRDRSRSILYIKAYMFYNGAASPRPVRDRSRDRSRSIL